MSGPAFTQTRELASTAAHKASDAYAMARQAEGRADGCDERMAACETRLHDMDLAVAAMLRRLIEAENELMRLRIIVDAPEQPRVTKRKAA